MMDAVPYAFLAVTLVGAVAVVMAYRPIRREPFTIFSFSLAWIAGELAFQNIVWQMIATALFIKFGALDGWAGYLGLALVVTEWFGLLGLGVAGIRAAAVVARSLDKVRSETFPVPDRPVDPTWGKWWRVTRAIPFKSRAVDVVHNIDYAGDGLSRHRLDVYRSKLKPGNAPPAPVMVYIHGGAWIIGDKREQGKPMMYELVAHGLGVRRHQLPPEPQGDLARPHRRRQAGGGVGQGAHRRVRRRPLVRRGQWGLGRRAPVRAARAERRRPGVPARVRGRRHLGPGLRALLRGDGHDGRPGRFGPVRARACSRCWRSRS